MITWLKHIKLRELVFAGGIYTVIAFVCRQIEAIFTLDYYMDINHFELWSKLMMPEAGPPPLQFILFTIVFQIITGTVFAGIYEFIRDKLPRSYWYRVLSFADIMIGLTVVLFTLPVYLLFNIQIGLLISWLITSCIILFLSSMAFVMILDDKGEHVP